MSESLSLCLHRHFLETVEDEEIRSVIQPIAEDGEKTIQWIQSIFSKENLPVPVGFTEQDVNLKAVRVFSDPFILQFSAFLGRAAMDASSMAISVSARADIRHFFMNSLNTYAKFEDKTFELLLKKGLFIRSPYIPLPDHVNFVHEQKFLTELLGERRPLNVIEINAIFINILRNSLGIELLTGFIQTVQSKDIREYMMRGKELSSKYRDTFNSLFEESDLPSYTLVGVGVTNSTEPPFSDKLMLNTVVTLNAIAIGLYGVALSQSARGDLAAHYTRIMAETGKYAADGANLLIKLGYLEQPPTPPNRKELTNESV